MAKTLEEIRLKIKEEAKFIGKKPYSHNIISLCLHEIDRMFGTIEANRAIKDFKLIKKGWNLKEEQ
jgi:hypothetical protein